MLLEFLTGFYITLFIQGSLGFESKEWSLSEFLVAGQDKFISPESRSPVNVKFSLKLVQIFEVNEKRQTMLSSLWLQQRWFDLRLRWNETDFDGINETSISSSLFWTPDIILDNTIKDSYMGRPVGMNSPLLVKSNGEVRWLTPIILTSQCKLNVEYFPFDEQFCPLDFISLTHNRKEIMVVPESSDPLSNFTANGEWEVEGVYPRTSFKPTNDLRDISIDRACVSYIIHIQRKTFYYFLYLISPCLLTSLLTIMVFALPPSSGERIVVGVTLLLSVVIFFMLASTHIPETSEAVPLIGKYYSLTIIQVAGALALTCLVLKYHLRDPSLGPVHSWIRVLVLGYVARMMRMKVDNSDGCSGECQVDRDPLSEHTTGIDSTHQEHERKSDDKSSNKMNKQGPKIIVTKPEKTTDESSSSGQEDQAKRREKKEEKPVPMETTAVIESPPERSKNISKSEETKKMKQKAQSTNAAEPPTVIAMKPLQLNNNMPEVEPTSSQAAEEYISKPMKTFESQPIKKSAVAGSEPSGIDQSVVEGETVPEVAVISKPMENSDLPEVVTSQPIRTEPETKNMSNSVEVSAVEQTAPVEIESYEPIKSPLPRPIKREVLEAQLARNRPLSPVEEHPERPRISLKISNKTAPMEVEGTIRKRAVGNKPSVNIKEPLSSSSEAEEIKNTREHGARRPKNKVSAAKACTAKVKTPTARSLPKCPSGILLMSEHSLRRRRLGTIQAEWQLAAAVLNRLFLTLYIIAVVLSLAGIFGQIPGFIVKRPDPPTSK